MAEKVEKKSRPSDEQLKDILVYWLNLVLEEDQLTSAIPLLFERIDQMNPKAIKGMTKNLQQLQAANEPPEKLFSVTKNLYEEGLETLFVLAGLP
ncbi:MAG: hypothetical protein ABII10_01880, partial [Candidatus Paceibacterota bacterium]